MLQKRYEFEHPLRLASYRHPEYSNTIRQHMNDWFDWFRKPTSWDAPYTSIVNSSMTGKSRCQKQLALHDPVIYFCLHPEKQPGYPMSGLPWVQEAIANPFGIAKDYAGGNVTFGGHTTIEERGVLGHLYFFRYVLWHMLKLVHSPEWEDKTKLQKREDLWYLFAEPDAEREGVRKMSKEADQFWQSVHENLQRAPKLPSETAALDGIKQTSIRLIRQLCDSNVETEQVILLMFDEAHNLTRYHCDGKEPPHSDARISQFQLLRRSLRKMGLKGIRIFSILTDTYSESRLANFQPNDHGSHDSARVIPAPSEIIGNIFPTLSQMPTIVNARHLQATCDPNKVQDVDRLMKFGRVGFSVMRKNRTAEWMLSFACYKLMQVGSDKIGAKLYFPTKKDKDLDRKFVALLGP
jgi:hypothetical protein